MFGFYRVAMCVPVTHVADPKFNAGQILSLIEKNKAGEVSVMLFPELALSSYTCGDLFSNTTLLRSVENETAEICRATEKLDSLIVLGAPVRANDKLYNAALVLQKGKILGIVPKTHLPNYREFYEKRNFVSGFGVRNQSISFAGQENIPFGTDLLFDAGDDLRVGVEICEDLWSTVPPSSYQALNSATLLLNLSASNDLAGKADYRRELVRNQSARCVAAYAYASAGVYESTTDMVCGGHCLLAENGRLTLDSERFLRENVCRCADIDLQSIRAARLNDTLYSDSVSTTVLPEFRMIKAAPVPVPAADAIECKPERMPFIPAPEQRNIRCSEIFAIQSAGLAKRMEHTFTKRLVIGISGGLDSTLALLVCVNTMKMLKHPVSDIIAVTMPGFGTTDRTYHNACNLCRGLGTTLREISIADACRSHFKDIGHDEKTHDVTYENAQARERTQILMDIANAENALVVGTGDLSEIAMGWCTYNGDHISNYAVNCSIPKTLIRVMTDYVADQSEPEIRALLKDVINTPVSPELLPAAEDGKIRQKTEDIIGPYEVHDFYLYYFIKYSMEPEKLLFYAARAFASEYPGSKLKEYLKLFLRRFFTQQFKRSCSTDGPKVGSIALSPRGDWRMPSDVSFDLWKL